MRNISSYHTSRDSTSTSLRGYSDQTASRTSYCGNSVDVGAVDRINLNQYIRFVVRNGCFGWSVADNLRSQELRCYRMNAKYITAPLGISLILPFYATRFSTH